MKDRYIVPLSSAFLRQGFRGLLGVSSSIAVVASTTYGQDIEEEIFELSPFEVSSSENSGYDVKETLAGSRLRTDVRDTSAAISILTTDFMDDLGASDLNDVADFLPSTETMGTTEGEGDNTGVYFPQGIRIRGLFANGSARNYFAGSLTPQDGYNTESITLSAGANSILFGAGNPAGVVNISTMQANFAGDSYRLRHRTDNYGTNRVDFNTNQVLIEDKLALRLAMLKEEGEGWRKPEWKNQEKIYGAVRWKISDRTTFTGNLEYSDFERNAPLWNVAMNFSNQYNGEPIAIDGTTRPHDLSDNGVTHVRHDIRPWPALGYIGGTPEENANFNWINYAKGNDKGYGFQGNGYHYPVDGFDNRINPNGNMKIDERLGYAGDITLEHRFTDDLHVQAAYFKYRTLSDIYTHWNGGRLRQDATSHFADGSVNPNANRYFTELAALQIRENENSGDTLRVTASYQLDLRERMEWAGRHQFAFLVEDRTGFRGTTKGQMFNYGENRPDSRLQFNAGKNKVMPLLYMDNVNGVDDMDIRDLPSYLSSFDGWDVRWGNFADPIHSGTEEESYLVAHQGKFLDDRLVTTVGYRGDSQQVLNPDPDTLGKIEDEDGIWFKAWDDPSIGMIDGDYVDANTYTYGSVYHMIRDRGALDYFSLAYNRSNNFQPGGVDFNFQNETQASASGSTIDYGIMFGAFKGKLTGKISFYESAKQNDKFGGGTGVQGTFNQIYERMSELYSDLDGTEPEYLEDGVTIREWTEFELEQFAMYPDSEAKVSDFDSRRINGNIGASGTQDRTMKGLEAQFSYSPTDSWRIWANVSRNESAASNIGPSVKLYLDEHMEQLRAELGDGAEIFGDGQADAEQRAKNTVGYRLDNQYASISKSFAREGETVAEMREWKANVVANYTFRDGSLRGFQIGGNVRWASKAAIGYPFRFDQASADAGADPWFIDISNPTYGDDQLNTGLKLSYKRKIANDKVTWNIQLNINNLLDDTDPQPIKARPYMEFADDEWVEDRTQMVVSGYKVIKPRSFVLTNTFSF